jgi:DNA polymerase elongation subunit (family B)
MKQPKILIYDIETSPNLAYVWGKYEQNVIDYEKERELLCVAYKWHGSKRIYCIDRQHDSTDKKLTAKVASLLQEADITVAHNGTKFDRKIIKTRMAYWNMTPLKIDCSVDTLNVAKNYFAFNGNSLNDLVKFLRIGIKKSTTFDIWKGCMSGDKKSWDTMKTYNKHDVMLLSKLYERFLPWIENHPSIAKLLHPYKENRVCLCPSCSSSNVQKYGFRATRASLQQRWYCLDCGKSFTTKFDRKKQ